MSLNNTLQQLALIRGGNNLWVYNYISIYLQLIIY